MTIKAYDRLFEQIYEVGGRSTALYSRFTVIIASSACLGHLGVCFLQFLQNQHPSLKVSL